MIKDHGASRRFNNGRERTYCVFLRRLINKRFILNSFGPGIILEAGFACDTLQLKSSSLCAIIWPLDNRTLLKLCHVRISGEPFFLLNILTEVTDNVWKLILSK